MLRARARHDAEPGDVVDARQRHAGRRRRQPMQLGKRRHDRIAERLDEAAGDGGGGFHGHLLPEDRPQAHLEPVEGSGHAQAGVALDGAGESRIPGQVLRDHVRPGVEIEQGADPAEKRRQRRCQRVGELEHQRAFLRRVGHANPASRVSQGHGPGIRVGRHPFDARQCARRKKREHTVPIVGRPIRELQRRGRAVCDLPRRPRSPSSAGVSAPSCSAR